MEGIARQCPYCQCDDSEACGREGYSSRSSRSRPGPIETYAAVMWMYSRDRSVLWTDPWHLALDLQYLGFLDRLPTVTDVGHAQDLIRAVEAPGE